MRRHRVQQIAPGLPPQTIELPVIDQDNGKVRVGTRIVDAPPGDDAMLVLELERRDTAEAQLVAQALAGLRFPLTRWRVVRSYWA